MKFQQGTELPDLTLPPTLTPPSPPPPGPPSWPWGYGSWLDSHLTALGYGPLAHTHAKVLELTGGAGAGGGLGALMSPHKLLEGKPLDPVGLAGLPGGGGGMAGLPGGGGGWLDAWRGLRGLAGGGALQALQPSVLQGLQQQQQQQEAEERGK